MHDYRYSYLKCTGCGDTFDFHIGKNTVTYTACESYKTAFSAELYHQSDNHFETADSAQVPPLLLSPCWCLHCDSATLIERIPDLDDYMKAAALRRLPEDKRDHQICDRLLELDESDFLLHYQ
ncbi:hypothetical protein ACO0LF_14920 [Undibacterium sp. Di27W]|uniref:hypothetical protein n=1 Tax=Undibacterium sp. Di27W TaxID=3413036 RepID=UPI003BF1C5DF